MATASPSLYPGRVPWSVQCRVQHLQGLHFTGQETGPGRLSDSLGSATDGPSPLCPPSPWGLAFPSFLGRELPCMKYSGMSGFVWRNLNMLFHFLQEIKLVKWTLLASLYRGEDVLKTTRWMRGGSRSQLRIFDGYSVGKGGWGELLGSWRCLDFWCGCGSLRRRDSGCEGPSLYRPSTLFSAITRQWQGSATKVSVSGLHTLLFCPAPSWNESSASAPSTRGTFLCEDTRSVKGGPGAFLSWPVFSPTSVISGGVPADAWMWLLLSQDKCVLPELILCKTEKLSLMLTSTYLCPQYHGFLKQNKTKQKLYPCLVDI